MGWGPPRHSSVDLPSPSILQLWVRISETPSVLFNFIVKFCTIFVNVLRKRTKITKRGQV